MSDIAIYHEPLNPSRSQPGQARKAVGWTHYDLDLSPRPAAQRPGLMSPPPTVQSLDRPLAGRHLRLAALLLDYAVLVGLYLAGSAAMEALNLGGSVKTVLVVSILLVLPVCQCVLLALRGQTLGKLLMGIRIVSADDDTNPGLWRAVALRDILPRIISLFPLLGRMFLLADVLWIFGDEKRCLHDLMADTKVVQA